VLIVGANAIFVVKYPPQWEYDATGKFAIMDKVPIRETWEAMEDVHRAGLAR
jgi:diketogulonate reductase-like aldo/keto reductase